MAGNGKDKRIGSAKYKGRKYALLFLGDTQHGYRAKLEFWDASKQFWADGNLLTEVEKDEETKEQRQEDRGSRYPSERRATAGNRDAELDESEEPDF